MLTTKVSAFLLAMAFAGVAAAAMTSPPTRLPAQTIEPSKAAAKEAPLKVAPNCPSGCRPPVRNSGDDAQFPKAPFKVAPNCGSGCRPPVRNSGDHAEFPQAPFKVAPNCGNCRPPVRNSGDEVRDA